MATKDDDEVFPMVDIPSDEEQEEIELEETLKETERQVALMREKLAPPEARPVVVRQPEVVDDFVRTFLLKNGMQQTLEMFETEWSSRQQSEEYKGVGKMLVADAYLQNSQLAEDIANLKEELTRGKEVADRALRAWEKAKKERDFHKMHHRRVAQQADGLRKDLKRLAAQCEKYDPMLAELEHRYQTAMKEKMMVNLEKDKLLTKVNVLENTIRELEGQRMPSQAVKEKPVKLKKNANDSPIPDDDRPNAFANVQFKLPHSPSGWGMRQVFKGHSMSVCGLCLHPSRPMVVTSSDDKTWKLWSVPNGELVMSGSHKDFVSAVCMHPSGAHLATASGDSTVKIWDFFKADCVHTFSDNSPVWSVAFHDTGNFLAASCLDHTIRVYDMNSHRTRATMRGHVDSVNCVQWRLYTNQLCSASGDKTVSMWDLRSSKCVATLFGHSNAVYSCSISAKGDILASCDADGKAIVWDLRKLTEFRRFDCGPHPANAICLDRAASYVAVGSEDSLIRVINLVDEKEGIKFMKGHEDSVLALQFDNNSGYLVSAGADATWRYWS